MNHKTYNFILPIFCFLSLTAVVFNPWGDQVFHLPKYLLLHFIVAIVFTLYIIYSLSFNYFEIPKNFILILITGLILINYLSNIFSILPALSWDFNKNFFVFCLIFYFSLFLSLKDFKKLFSVLVIFSFPIAFYAFSQRMGLDIIYWGDPLIKFRPSSTNGNPDFLAAYLCIIIPLNLYFVFSQEKFLTKLSFLIILFFNIGGLFISFSRAGIFAFIFAFFVFIIIIGKETLFKEKKIFVVIFIFLIIILQIFIHTKIPAEAPAGEKIKTVNIVERVSKSSGSIKVRLFLWRDTLYAIKDKMLLGYGPGNFSWAYIKKRGVEILRIQAVTALPEDAHNLILQTTVTTGLLGLFFTLWIMIYVIFALAKKIISTNDLFYKSILIAFIAFIIQSLFNALTPETNLMFFLFLGVSFNSKYKKLNINFTLLSRKILQVMFVLFFLVLFKKTFTPLVADRYFRLANENFRENKLKLAVLNCAVAADLNPKNGEYFRTLALIYRQIGELTKNKKAFDNSIEAFKYLIKLNPLDASSYNDLAKAYLEFGDAKKKDYFKQAESNYLKAIFLDYNYPIFHNNYGIALLNHNNFNKAQQELNLALKMVPIYDEPFVNLGVLYYREKNYMLAIKYTKEALKLNPANKQAKNNLKFLLQKVKPKNKQNNVK